MTFFQRLALVTCVLVFGLIVLGGVVRATDSGLGCPDWPRCHGSFIPKWEKHTLIEYSHRFVASTAGLMVFGMAVAAWRSHRRAASILYPSLAAAVLVVFQGILGGITVVNELPAAVVSLHLATALTLLALLMLIAVAAFTHGQPFPRIASSSNFRQLALLCSAAVFGLMAVGAYVAGAGYGLACSGWPLCNGDVVPRTTSTSVDIHFLHRVLALVVGMLVLALAYAGFSARRRAPVAAVLSVTAFALVVAQALLGAAQIWTGLDAWARVAHLAVGSSVWTVLAILNILIFRVPRLIDAALPVGAHASADLAGATR